MPLSDASLTVSDFDPEHEALASTREFGSPELPNMNYHDEPDFAINTSTLDRAFPDFSQLPTSEEEDAFDGEINEGVDAGAMSDSEGELSLELGRGLGKASRRLDDSRDSIMSFQNSVRSSSPAVRVDYPTPQKQQPARSTRRAASDNLRKDAQLRRATQAQKEIRSPQVSNKTRDQRRTFSDMHAKVRDNYDGSFLGDERPAPVNIKPRSTRFNQVNNSQEIAEAIERASREAYSKERNGSAAGTPRKNIPVSNTLNHNNTMGDTMTRQSFLLPDLPNISELVSGVYEDGTPVFSRQHKMRSTRFVSPPHDATDVSMTREHMPLDAVPIPEDEKALFVSLRLLQDKVAELEMFKSDAEKRIDHYRQENAALKRSRHSDKHQIDDSHKGSSKRLITEYQKLEAANIALQNQLDIADRKTQVQEAAVKRLNQDRESAISQLGVAYLETRELKIENEQLRQENAELKSQLPRYSGKKAQEQEMQEIEASFSASDAEESQIYTERSGDMSRSTRDITSRSTRSNRRQEESRAKVSSQVDKEIGRLEKESAEEALFSLNVPDERRSSSKIARSELPRHSELKNARKQSNTSKQRSKRVMMEEKSGPVDVTEQTRASSEAEDLTLLSVIDTNEIARLRKTLEEERLSRKNRRSSMQKDLTANDTVNSTRQSVHKAPLPRKSSLKAPQQVPLRPASAMGDTTSRSVAISDGDASLVVPTADRPRRHSDHSVASISQKKKRSPMEDMTSAFILPDITLSRAELAASNPLKLPQATQRALDGIAQHDGKNCMAVKIPKPVPVSERMPEPTPYNEDPTMRPSQPPAVALATVLKALEDELSHLKMQLAGYQSAFNKLDASLGKKQRKALTEKVEKLIKDIDLKSDQIYALYDVLEGHKGRGDITEQEMEMTLQSIGLDTTTNTMDKRQAEDESEDELPWEGIESTAELSGRV
ncbi:uncharacterized protein N7477_001850 [Penicillium maclennaniae]|uniref:uncharacterized protein n=1 Tax=Penicillium maclennaniae TaxID=1343394 RepID=UPI0025406D39|nr:uncharacterized protein N7477_001850 [Penicillium maclennaniae]KAJ5681910.1 hypothetical protein N7477_001850 [Penicillium maclennaniae]